MMSVRRVAPNEIAHIQLLLHQDIPEAAQFSGGSQ